MIRFLIKLTYTFLILYIILFGIQFVLDYQLSKENICKNNTWHKIFKGKLDSEIVIIGTSRAEVHYDPEIINQITGLKTYNLGLSGTPYSVLKIRWKSYFNRNKMPKAVIIDVDASSLQGSKKLFNKYQYLPFLYSNEYQLFVKENDTDFYFEKYIPLYKYRGYEMKIFKQLKSLHSSEDCSDAINGYVEQDLDWLEKDYLKFKKILQKDNLRGEYNLDIYNEGLSTLKEIINDCKHNNINVYLFWSPSYKESQTYQLTYKLYIDRVLTNIAEKEDIKYINYSNDSLCIRRKYFYNSSHLNKNGATLFSEKIGNLIKDDLEL